MIEESSRDAARRSLTIKPRLLCALWSASFTSLDQGWTLVLFLSCPLPRTDWIIACSDAVFCTMLYPDQKSKKAGPKTFFWSKIVSKN